MVKIAERTSFSHIAAMILMLLLIIVVIFFVTTYGGETIASIKNLFGFYEEDKDDIDATRLLYYGMKYCQNEVDGTNCLCDTGRSFTLKTNKVIRVRTEGDVIYLSDSKTINNAIACFMTSDFWNGFNLKGCGNYMQLRLNEFGKVYVLVKSEEKVEDIEAISSSTESDVLGEGGGGTAGGGEGGGEGGGGAGENLGNTEGTKVFVDDEDYAIPEENVLTSFVIDTDTLKLYKYDHKGDTYISFVDEKDLDKYRLCSDLNKCYGEICESEDECLYRDEQYIGEGICCKACHKVLSEEKENEAEELFNQAVALYKSKSYVASESLFKKLIEDYINSKRVDDSWLYLGRIYRDKGDKKTAMIYYSHCVGDFYNLVGTDYGDVVFRAEEESDDLFDCVDFSYSLSDDFENNLYCQIGRDSVLNRCSVSSPGFCEECDLNEDCTQFGNVNDWDILGSGNYADEVCDFSLCRFVGEKACTGVNMNFIDKNIQNMREIVKWWNKNILRNEKKTVACLESDEYKECGYIFDEWMCETEVCFDAGVNYLGNNDNDKSKRSLCCEWVDGVCKHK